MRRDGAGAAREAQAFSAQPRRRDEALTALGLGGTWAAGVVPDSGSRGSLNHAGPSRACRFRARDRVRPRLCAPVCARPVREGAAAAIGEPFRSRGALDGPRVRPMSPTPLPLLPSPHRDPRVRRPEKAAAALSTPQVAALPAERSRPRVPPRTSAHAYLSSPVGL